MQKYQRHILLCCTFDNPSWLRNAPIAFTSAAQLELLHMPTLLPKTVELVRGATARNANVGGDVVDDSLEVLQGNMPMVGTVKRVLISLPEAYKKSLRQILQYQGEVGANQAMHCDELRSYVEKQLNTFWTTKHLHNVIAELETRCSSQNTKRDDAVHEKHNATMQFAKKKTRRCSPRKTKRDDAVHEKHNATMQFAKNKTRRCSSRKTKRNDAVREK